jgi:hypothetical protein
MVWRGADRFRTSPPLAGMLRLGTAACRSGGIEAICDAPAKRRVRPIRRVFRQAMLDRVEMRVVHMSGIIAIVADRMFPIPPLLDAALPAAGHDRRARLSLRQGFRKCDFDCASSTGEVGVAWRRGPQAMHMVGQNDSSIDAKGRPQAPAPDRLTQDLDRTHQQVRISIAQVHGKEEGPTRNPIAAILRHRASMPCVGKRRNALRCSALRVLVED